jgi:recombination protein RecA
MRDEKKLEAAIATIEKDFGKGAIMRMSEHPIEPVDVISSGSYGVNHCLGIGGYPKGRIIEIYGPESSGKTTLTLHAIAECQKKGGCAAFVDAEHAIDPKYAENLGVDMSQLLLSQPDNGEQALEIVDRLVGSVDVIVIDSVAALVPRAEIEGEMGDTHVGLQARLMSQALRKLTSKVHKSNTTVFFINQIRMKIGVMFGSHETTSGGNALKFYSSVRLDIRRIGQTKKGEENVGNRTKVKVAKNKLAPPFKVCEFDIVFGQGINYVGELLDAAEAAGIVNRAGAWYSFDSERIGQGRDQAIEYLRAHIELANSIERKLLGSGD